MSMERFIDNGFYKSEIYLLAKFADMLSYFPELEGTTTSGSCWTELTRARCIDGCFGNYSATNLGREVLQFLINNPYKWDEFGYVRVINLEKYK